MQIGPHHEPAQAALRLYAAGSLRAVLTEIGAAFQTAGGSAISANYGASGLLHDRIAAGETADIFASANMAHPESLHRAGGFGPPQLFARNTLCALVHADEPATTATLLDRMLDDTVRLGTSTPGADPSGDYAFAAFARAEAIRPGAEARLATKALQLTGNSAQPGQPAGTADRSIYTHLLESRTADIFLTYRTNAQQSCRELPGLRLVTLPPALAVGADYGLTVARSAPAGAAAFADYILSRSGQAILAAHGFGALAEGA